MLRKRVLLCCLVSMFLFFFSTAVWAKCFVMILHYDKGVISVNKDSILEIRDGDVSVEKRTYVAQNNKIYKCNVLSSTGEILFSSSVDIPLVMMWDGLDEKGNQTGGSSVREQADFVVTMPYVDNAAVIKIVSQDAADKTGKTLVEEISITKDRFINVSTAKRVITPKTACDLDIVFLGHGYPYLTGIPAFVADVQAVMNHLESTSPFDAYAVKMVAHTNVTQSGFYTSQGCYYGCGGSATKICCNDNTVYNHALQVYVDYNEIIVLVNDPDPGSGAYTTCGGGGKPSYAAFYNGTYMLNAAVHEFGHSFGGLNDEYVSGGSYTICFDANCCDVSDCSGCGCVGCGSGCFTGCTQNYYSRCFQDCRMKAAMNYSTPYCPKCETILDSLLSQCW